MNRRLHNTTTASVATGALLLLGLALGATAPDTARTAAAQPDAQVLPVAAAAATGSTPRRHRGRLVMPYFSFSRS